MKNILTAAFLLISLCVFGQNKIKIKIPYLPIYVDSVIQQIDTFEVFDTNKLRISLTQDGQPAKVVTLPSGGGGGGIDSTIVAAGYGINVNESPANTWTVKADTSKIATLYDVSQVDQSVTNELQKIDTFQVFDTNKLRISLQNDNEAAKVVTLPTGGGGGGGIDSTVVNAGYGLTVSESPANTWNIAADSSKLATQFDINGFIDGTGTATRPAIFQDANTLTTDSNLDWNNTDKRLLVGPNTATETPNKLQVVGSANVGQYLMHIENESNNTSSGGINIFGSNTNTAFIPLNTRAVTTGSVLINNTNASPSVGNAYINTSVSGTGNAYFVAQKFSNTAWSLGMKQTETYNGRFTISESTTLTAAGERFSIGTGGTVRIKSLDTDLAAPSTSGIIKAVITDSNGDLSFTNFQSGIDSTVVTAGYGLFSTESPANTFTVRADTSKLVTQYDLSLVDQSATNEIQVIDTFQVYDTNKLRVSISQDGEPAKVVTLPTAYVQVPDSTNVTAGYGIDVTESPSNTYNVKADTSEIATTYDLTQKQNVLISGTNIKTVNSNSLLGSGNVSVGTVTSIGTSAPISGGTITGSGTIGLNYDGGTLTLSGSNLAARSGAAIWNANSLQNTVIQSPLTPSIGHVLTYTALNQWESKAPPSGTTNLTFTGTASPFTLNSDTGSDVTFAAGSGISLTRSTNELTIASTVTNPETWADIGGDVISWASTGTFNSGKQVGIGTLNAARLLDVNGDTQLRGAIYNSSSSSGSSGQVLTSGGTGAWTWTTPADGSSTNELQTLSHASDATTHTTTLSNSGGSLILAEGSGISLTTSSNQVTIAATASATDLSFTGTASPVTLNSSSGTDVTLTAGSGISLAATSGNTTITASDASATNELQTISTTGTAGNITLSNGGGTLTLNVDDADASPTNEIQTLSHASTLTTHSVTLSNSGGSLVLTEGAGISLTTSSNNVTIANTQTIKSGIGELYRSLTDLNNASLTTTPVKFDFDSGTFTNSITLSTATDRITNTLLGNNVIRITYSGSFDLTDSRDVVFMIYKNGVSIGYLSDLIISGDTTTKGFSKSFMLQSPQNDYYELFYKINSGTPVGINLKNVNFNIELMN